MKRSASFIYIFLMTAFVLLPLISNPEMLFGRNNDLSEFFYPIFNFIRMNFDKNKELPLWNNVFLSGTPLLPDPQSPLFYIPNIIYLIFTFKQAVYISIFLHLLTGGISFYLLCNSIFKFDQKISTFIACLYIGNIKVFALLEAGHLGLLQAWGWIPLAVYLLFSLYKDTKLTRAIFLGLVLSFIFYSHVLTFFICLLAIGLLSILINFYYKTLNYKFFVQFLLAIILCFSLSAISLIPQISWTGETTRYLLVNKPDVYPKWSSKMELIKLAVTPLIENFKNFDTEKAISIGILPAILSIFGFIKLKKSLKIYLIIISIPLLLISLNNSSLIYSVLMRIPAYALLRVSTRVWFIITLILLILSGFGLSKLNKNLQKVIIILGIFEILLTGYLYISKPYSKPKNEITDEIYQLLSSKDEIYRVFCTTRCISQSKASQYNLQLVDGYSTLQQNNYYKLSWQFTNSHWDYYSLSTPPFGIYLYKKIQPDPISLGLLNTKFVISPHTLTDKNFVLYKTISNFKIYKNKLYHPRAWGLQDKEEIPLSIKYYSPNKIIVNTDNSEITSITFSEIYSSGWIAYLNGSEKTEVLENPIGLRSVNIKNDTKYVELVYEPSEFKIGFIITISSYLLIIIYAVAGFTKRHFKL